MIKIISRAAVAVVGIALLVSPFSLRPLLAQDHSQMHHEQSATPAKKAKPRKKPVHNFQSRPNVTMPAMEHGQMPGTDHGGHEMKAFLGPYASGREGSGTSWQPDNSPHGGIHAQYGEW